MHNESTNQIGREISCKTVLTITLLLLAYLRVFLGFDLGFETIIYYNVLFISLCIANSYPKLSPAHAIIIVDHPPQDSDSEPPYAPCMVLEQVCLETGCVGREISNLIV